MKKADKFDVEQWLWDAAAKVAREWYAKQLRNEYAAFYLYYRAGELGAFEEKPEGWILGNGERLSPALSREQITRKVYEMARGIPCLPAGV